MTKQKTVNTHPEDMSAAELAAATRRFDEPFVFEKGRPLTPAQRKQERELRSRGRTAAAHARKVSISLDPLLIKKADALAHERGVTRSQLLSGVLAAGLRRQAV